MKKATKETGQLVQGRLYRETDKAICLDVCPQGFIWFPKSCCTIERFGDDQTNIDLYVPFHIAEAKGCY